MFFEFTSENSCFDMKKYRQKMLSTWIEFSSWARGGGGSLVSFHMEKKKRSAQIKQHFKNNNPEIRWETIFMFPMRLLMVKFKKVVYLAAPAAEYTNLHSPLVYWFCQQNNYLRWAKLYSKCLKSFSLL